VRLELVPDLLGSDLGPIFHSVNLANVYEVARGRGNSADDLVGF
jgi:hypothetical protein